MFLTVHTAVAVAVGAKLTNPILAFFIGILSHFLLDAIPHGDEKIITNQGHKKRILLYSIMALIDGLLSLSLVFILGYFKLILLTPATIFIVFGALIPDLIWGIQEIFKSPIIAPFSRIHSWFHRNLIKTQVSVPVGLIIQVITLATFLFILINFPA